MHYVYILISEKDGKFYTGSTSNLNKRRKPLRLTYYEACIDEKDARQREKYLKTGMGKKYIRGRIKNYLENL